MIKAKTREPHNLGLSFYRNLQAFNLLMKNKNKRQVDLANFINFKSNKNPKTSLESLEILWSHVYKPKQKPCSFKSLLNGFILKKHKPTKPKQINKKHSQKNPKKTNPQCAQILQLKLAEDQTDSKLFFHVPNNSFNLQVSTIQLTEINI